MSFYRYLPTPSDRMGIMWKLLSIKDSIVLEYGPAGTTHYSMGSLGSMGLNIENNLFTTHMSEEDVVMGDVSRLENAICEVDESYKPKVIFVMASAITSVIGADIPGVCHYMQERIKAKLVPVDEGGFKGDYSVGLGLAYNLLAKELIKPSEKKQLTYNILGACQGSFRINSDVWEVESLLSEAFNLKKGATLGLESTTEELENMSNAAFNIVLRAEAVECAKFMESEFGIPFVYGSPYGYTGTLEWLQSVGDVLGIEINQDLKVRIEEKAQEANQLRMYSMMGGRGLKASLVGDYDVICGLYAFLSEVGFGVENVIFSHSLQGIYIKKDGVVHYENEKDKLDILKSLKGHLILGDDVCGHVAKDGNTCVTVSSPFFRQRQIATHFPIMGERGADGLVEVFYRYLSI